MTIYIIDGNSYIHRAYHAIQNLTTSKGEQVNAVFGFTKMLLKILRTYKPDYIAVCMDYPAPTFRHKEFSEYKAHRKKTAEELKNQFPLVKKIISAFNIKIFEKEGYEADDLIATLSEKVKNKGIDVVIVTSDKDAFQLVDKNVKVLNEPKNILYDKEEVVKKLGVGPENVVDYLALAGDSSDNVPGIPGIGEKTAAKLISEFGNLENIFTNIPKIKGKLGTLITEHSDSAVLSKKLVTLVKDTPDPTGEMELEQLKIKEPDNEKLLNILKQLEFYSLIKLLVKEEKAELSDFQIANNDEQIKNIFNIIKDSDKLSFFISPVGIALQPEKNKAFYVPLSEVTEELTLIYHKQTKTVPASEIFGHLKPIFENNKILKITHGAKNQFTVLEKYGILIPENIFDTEIASYLLNPSGKNHSLSDISIEHLGIKIDTYEGNYENLEISEAKNIFCKKTDVMIKSYEILQEKLHSLKLLSLFNDIEMPLTKVLYKMEDAGIKIDETYFKKLSDEFNGELNKLEKIIFSTAGEQFNINSPKQLARILFDKMGLTPVKKIKTGFSTGEEVLTILAETSELPKIILEYREISKLKST
ncbi:MAG: DNA polymerase I, partial [Elusimicrobia bacterium HGW-Elusimicrobia-4]